MHIRFVDGDSTLLYAHIGYILQSVVCISVGDRAYERCNLSLSRYALCFFVHRSPLSSAEIDFSSLRCSFSSSAHAAALWSMTDQIAVSFIQLLGIGGLKGGKGVMPPRCQKSPFSPCKILQIQPHDVLSAENSVLRPSAAEFTTAGR